MKRPKHHPLCNASDSSPQDNYWYRVTFTKDVDDNKTERVRQGSIHSECGTDAAEELEHTAEKIWCANLLRIEIFTLLRGKTSETPVVVFSQYTPVKEGKKDNPKYDDPYNPYGDMYDDIPFEYNSKKYDKADGYHWPSDYATVMPAPFFKTQEYAK